MATDTVEAAARHAPASTVDAVRRALELSSDPVRGAFLARGIDALARLAARLPERSLGDAVGHDSAFSALLRALEDPAAAELLRSPSAPATPFAAARLRGLAERDRVLQAEGGTVGAEAMARGLRVTRQAVEKRRRAGQLIGLATGRRAYAYPVWQVAPEGGALPGLERVLAAFVDRDPWVWASYMVRPDDRLDGRTPLAALRGGEVDAVVRAAAAYGTHGAS
jgi:hypothetical protein